MSWSLSRALLLRGLGGVYVVAFLVLARQHRALFGHEGLTPADGFLARVGEELGAEAYTRLPTIFWVDASDGALATAAWVGVAGAAAMVAGCGNSVLIGALWALYLSFVHVGQAWYGYGWETLLLEAGFLAIFLGSPTRWRPTSPPSWVVLLLYRWLLFRLMLGAGLIKLRGDDCWRDLTCLVHHYETQPNPNPLSLWFHRLPYPVHGVGVLWNHVVELVVPWLLLGPRPARTFAGVITGVFQVTLILSGNLAFLNWLTLVLCVACLDDGTLGRFFRRSPEPDPPAPARRWVVGALAALVAVKSVEPVENLLSPAQAMNASFDPLHLVNTYGAFGSVGRERLELVIEGTDDGETWYAYELPCKPTDPARRPCWISPYHLRLDWQMWFAAQQPLEQHPWLVHLVRKLLRGDPAVRDLLARDPFPGPPPWKVRVDRYVYAFAEPGDAAWWTRRRVGSVIRPVEVDDPGLVEAVRHFGWD
ncbi:MAG: lipase maturation factor family protein [Myxococcota bacterium]